MLAFSRPEQVLLSYQCSQHHNKISMQKAELVMNHSDQGREPHSAKAIAVAVVSTLSTMSMPISSLASEGDSGAPVRWQE